MDNETVSSGSPMLTLLEAHEKKIELLSSVIALQQQSLLKVQQFMEEQSKLNKINLKLHLQLH